MLNETGYQLSRRLSKNERTAKARDAVAMRARGATLDEIGTRFEVTRQTARRWIDDELAERSEHRGADKEKAIAVYSEIIRAAWERFDATDNRSLNTSGLLNTIKAAQERIDKITGAEAPTKLQVSEEDYEVVWHDIDPSEITEE